MKDFEQISLSHWMLGGIGLYGRYPVVSSSVVFRLFCRCEVMTEFNTKK